MIINLLKFLKQRAQFDNLFGTATIKRGWWNGPLDSSNISEESLEYKPGDSQDGGQDYSDERSTETTAQDRVEVHQVSQPGKMSVNLQLWFVDIDETTLNDKRGSTGRSVHVVLEVVEEVDVNKELFSTAGKQFQWICHYRSHGLSENRPLKYESGWSNTIWKKLWLPFNFETMKLQSVTRI